MTAPRDLPPCPLPECARIPTEGWVHTTGQRPCYSVGCYGSDHTISVHARTKAAARGLWRRLARGAK